MKNKLALSFLMVLAILLTACGPQATAMPPQTAQPASNGGGSANTAMPPVVATDTTSAGNSGTSPQATAASNTTSSGGSVAVSVGSGSFLVDAKGMTLYMYTKDSAGTSTCTGGCANNWPPLTVTGQATAGTGVTASMLGTTTRADGSTQVTYNGHPLYYFKSDSAAGDKNGEGVGGVWYEVSASGDAMK